MTRQEFRELTEKKRVILDGATGSCLIAAGMPSGVCPEQWILEDPEVLIRLQADYLQAGTDILYAPTFSANRIKLAEYGLSGRVIKMNGELIALSKEAVRRAGREGNAYVAADLNGYEDKRDSLVRYPFRMMKQRPIFARRGARVKLRKKG